MISNPETQMYIEDYTDALSSMKLFICLDLFLQLLSEL